jgi:hypothetical protein
MVEAGFRVFIPDPTHGEGVWREGANSGPISGDSAEFRQVLEAEYGEEFHFASIGTGAAQASYFVQLLSDPYRDAAAAVALFYLGKPIKDAFESWAWVYRQLSKFFHHAPTFDREAAAILAYQAVVEKLGGVPNTYRLVGFSIQHRLSFPDPSNPPDPNPPTSIAAAPERVQSAMIYVFRVVADTREFRLTVDGHNVRFFDE